MSTYVVEEPSPSSKARTLALVARVLDYAFGLVYGILAIRLVLELINARRSAGFYQFIASVTDPFYGPFKSIVGTDTIDGAHVVWPLVIAIAAYMVLHAAIRGLLHLVGRA